jgi:hypothetical protein
VAAAPVAVGTALAVADGQARALPALAALAGALLIQIGANFANDVFDFERGADTEARIGPPRAAQLGLLTPGQMKVGTALAFGCAVLVGIYLVAVAGWPIVAIGILSIAAGLAYTGGPFAFGYHGLGEVAVFDRRLCDGGPRRQQPARCGYRSKCGQAHARGALRPAGGAHRVRGSNRLRLRDAADALARWSFARCDGVTTRDTPICGEVGSRGVDFP